MKTTLAAFVCGLLFGAGLTVAQMTNPEKVIGFLDVFGRWDASLALVMLGALAVAGPLFRRILRRPAPVLAEKFDVPARSVVDRRLIIGSAIFGIGWGLAGYCPGPAVAGLGLGNPEALIMIAGIYAGFIFYRIAVSVFPNRFK